MKTYDVIVAGLGAMGSAAVYQLSKTGLRVLGIDQFDPPHELGSTHGETRITRLSIGEGDEFMPLVRKSNEIWEELTDLSDTKLLIRTGCLIFSSEAGSGVVHGKSIVGESIRIAEEWEIPHRSLEHGALAEQFPQLKLGPGASGYYESGGGYLIPEKCVTVLLSEAGRNGAELRTREAIIDIDRQTCPGLVLVKTKKGEYLTRKLILSVGAWIGKFLRQTPSNDIFRIYRQTMFWFETMDDYSEESFPVYIKAGDDERSSYYGFPSLSGSNTIKVGIEQFEKESDPDTVDRTVAIEEVENASSLVSESFSIRSEPVKTKTCLYTMTPDFGFVVDFLPDNDNVLVVSPCSGHGFKHSAGVGLLASQMITGDTPFTDPAPYKFLKYLK